MLQSGIITAEQADRLIKELKDTPEKDQTSEKTSEPRPEDLFSSLQNLGIQFAKGMEDLAKGLHGQVKQAMGLPPLQTLTMKVYQMEPEKEITKLSVPLHLFHAFKGLLTNRLLAGNAPLIDFELVYKALEAGNGGKVAEFSDGVKNQRIEFWLE